MRWLLLVGVLCWCAGCGDDTNNLGDMPGQASLRLLGVVGFDSQDCTTWPGSPMLASGVMDALLTGRYQAALAVENTGAEDVAMRTAEVTLSDTQGNEVRTFWADVGGLIAAGQSGMTLAPLIPSPQGLASNVLAEVRVTGETSTRTVESLSLVFPIQICSGCLIEFPAEADDPTEDGYQCSEQGDSEVVSPCLFGQDSMVDCRLCATFVPECVEP
jgi:hypothetical protein